MRNIAASHQAKTPHRDRAFTVAELLAVVAVFSILLALLQPTFNRARDITRRAICMSQLHQHQVAARNYATEWRGFLPKMYHVAGEPKKFSYSDKLRPYLLAHDIFHCPSATPKPAKITSINKKRLDYGINHYGRGTGDWKNYHDTMGFGLASVPVNEFGVAGAAGNKRISDVANPTAIYFADAEVEASPEDIGGVSRGTIDWPLRVSFDVHAFKRHVEGYNAVGLDGTARWHRGDVATNDAWFVRRRIPVATRAEETIVYSFSR